MIRISASIGIYLLNLARTAHLRRSSEKMRGAACIRLEGAAIGFSGRSRVPAESSGTEDLPPLSKDRILDISFSLGIPFYLFALNCAFLEVVSPICRSGGSFLELP
jgi:hypothetical protein